MADLDDVQKRVMRILLGKKQVALAHLDRPTVVVAQELYPSDTAAMNREHVQGMITERGGVTSHVAILARTLGIPACVATPAATTAIQDTDWLYIDATDPEDATVYVNPAVSTRGRLDERRERYQKRKAQFAKEKSLAPISRDGHRMVVSANIGAVDDVEQALADGAGSIGLFRSEFLFINSQKIPDEETQFQAYKTAAESFPDGFVILRTLDVGADKPIESISIPAEENPFLGYRGVRISLDRKDLFTIQLRAALRASAFGPLKIMFPMISGPNEVRTIISLITDIKTDLSRQGIAYSPAIDIGIMLEVPSAIFMVPELIKLVDFLSIGTNDLTQYLLAADRMNENIRAYYQSYHPSVFRAISLVVEAAHAENKWVGICGELAGMSLAIPALIGLGVDELSMSSQSLPEAIHIIRNTDYESAKCLANSLMALDDEPQIKALLQQFAGSKE